MKQTQQFSSLAPNTVEAKTYTDPRFACDPGAFRPFEFIEFFTGRTQGWGFFQDRFNRKRMTFSVEMRGCLSNGLFVLDETFVYGDGRIVERCWRVERRGPGRYDATGTDIIGSAVGESFDSGIRWRYVMAVPIGGRTVNLSFDDRIFAQSGDDVLNLSDASKWGVRVGRLCAMFKKT